MLDANCQCFLYNIPSNGLIIFLGVPFIPDFVTSGLKRMSSSTMRFFKVLIFNSGLKLTFRRDITSKLFFETQITITVKPWNRKILLL